MIEAVKSLTRPLITLILVTAFSVACFQSETAAQLLAGPMGIAVGFWFNDRIKKSVQVVEEK